MNVLEQLSLPTVDREFDPKDQAAIDHYQKQLKIARRIEDKRGEAYILENLGIVYQTLGEYQTAINYLQQQLEIAQEI